MALATDVNSHVLVLSTDERRCAAQGPVAPARTSFEPRYWLGPVDRILPSAMFPSFDAVLSPLRKILTWLRRIPLPTGSFLRRTPSNLGSNITGIAASILKASMQRLERPVHGAPM